MSVNYYCTKLACPIETIYNDKELLKQLSQGCEKAFKTIFDRYRDKLFSYISHFIKSNQVAEELVMDVFMKIWMGRELVTQINNIDAFLFRVAHNKSIDFLRSAAKDARLKELLWNEIQLYSTDNVDASLLSREYESKIREAINLLSPQRKKVYILSREQDYTHDQIAVSLNISKATVNNHIVEAQKFIRTFLVKNLDLAIIILMINRH
jgi:RNA polymerase sigma-70 factor (ECF subfamily)